MSNVQHYIINRASAFFSVWGSSQCSTKCVCAKETSLLSQRLQSLDYWENPQNVKVICSGSWRWCPLPVLLLLVIRCSISGITAKVAVCVYIYNMMYYKPQFAFLIMWSHLLIPSVCISLAVEFRRGGSWRYGTCYICSKALALTFINKALGHVWMIFGHGSISPGAQGACV